MLKHKSVLKLLLVCILSITNLYSIEVLVAKSIIKFNERVLPTNLRFKKVNSVRKSCIPATLSGIGQDYYISTHYINPGSIICEKDIKIHEKKTVVFKFGNIEIEKEGKVVGETKRYIRIKKPNDFIMNQNISVIHVFNVTY